MVFLNQLKAWTLHGLLADPFEEFFIIEKMMGTGARGRFKGRVVMFAHHDFHYYKLCLLFCCCCCCCYCCCHEWQAPSLSLTTSNTLEPPPLIIVTTITTNAGHLWDNKREDLLVLLEGGMEEEDAEHEWRHKYQLQMDKAPLDFFPAHLATRIFFIGRAVRVLQKTSAPFKATRRRKRAMGEKGAGIGERW